MQSVLDQISEMRGLVLAHVAVGLFLMFFYAVVSDKRFFSRGKVFLFGALYALGPAERVCWCIGLSRLITAFSYAMMPGKTDLVTGAVLGVQTLLIVLISRDSRTWPTKLLGCAAVFASLLLQGLFYSYYREVEARLTLPVIVIFMGVFASLLSLYQFITGHEQLVKLSHRSLKKAETAEVQKQKTSEETTGREDAGAGTEQ